jgi:hypothetical protein
VFLQVCVTRFQLPHRRQMSTETSSPISARKEKNIDFSAKGGERQPVLVERMENGKRSTFRLT